MQFRYKKDYLKRFDRFNQHDKELIISADQEIRQYYSMHTASYGLRIKKLHDDGKDKIFEARVTDKIRIMWLESERLVSFVVLGNHDEVTRYAKSIR